MRLDELLGLVVEEITLLVRNIEGISTNGVFFFFFFLEFYFIEWFFFFTFLKIKICLSIEKLLLLVLGGNIKN